MFVIPMFAIPMFVTDLSVRLINEHRNYSNLFLHCLLTEMKDEKQVSERLQSSVVRQPQTE